MSFAFGAEHFTVVECESRFIDKKVDECVVFEVKPCTVEPYDKGGLRPDGFDIGNITIEKLFDKVYFVRCRLTFVLAILYNGYKRLRWLWSP